MTARLRISFEVACSAEHAFAVWTSAIGTWWPPDHTVSGRPQRVVLQAGIGGRIYERTPEGIEHDWGTVTGWEPPSRLAYHWHIGRGPDEATEVEIRFQPQGPALTLVEIDHSGWERLGPAGDERHARNRAGWETLLPHFRQALAQGGS